MGDYPTRLTPARVAALVLLLACGAARADPVLLTNGGDMFIAGTQARAPLAAPRDVLAGGGSVVLTGTVAQDTHATGFSVEIEADTAGSVYAAGAMVTLRGTIGQDVTATGGTVRTAPSATVAGNVRISGGLVTIEGPVTGAVTASGGEVVLNSAVAGDVVLQAQSISFGPSAKIAGTLRYFAPEAVIIPVSVISADRVTFTKIDALAMFRGMGGMMKDRDFEVWPSFASLFAGFLLTLGFFILLGAVLLAFLPRPVERLRQISVARPGFTLLAGLLGLSALFGLVPVSAMTVVGVLLVPFVVLAVVVVWTLGYVLGAYVIALRMLVAFGGAQTHGLGARLAVLAVGVAVLAALNFVPFIGWMINFAVVLFGVGAMVVTVANRMIASPGPALDVDMQPVSDPTQISG